MLTLTEDFQFEQLQTSICDPTSEFYAFTWLKKVNQAPQRAQPGYHMGNTPVDEGEFSSFWDTRARRYKTNIIQLMYQHGQCHVESLHNL